MKNLAGLKEADEYIKEELYLAGIETISEKSDGEVPYTIIGRLGKWAFRRAWYYWVAKVEFRTAGLPVDQALELYNRKNPINGEILGGEIRSGGAAGSSAPDDYTAQPVYNEELENQLLALGYKKQYSDLLEEEYISINLGEMAELSKAGKITVPRYVDTYHIDTQIGLVEFAKFLKSFYMEMILTKKK
jgi:hypothetical protein